MGVDAFNQTTGEAPRWGICTAHHAAAKKDENLIPMH